jgi:hypothetical protein
MEGEDSLACSQETVLEPIQLNLVHIASYFFKSHINIMLSFLLGPQSGGLLLAHFPNKMSYTLLR